MSRNSKDDVYLLGDPEETPDEKAAREEAVESSPSLGNDIALLQSMQSELQTLEDPKPSEGFVNMVIQNLPVEERPLSDFWTSLHEFFAPREWLCGGAMIAAAVMMFVVVVEPMGIASSNTQDWIEPVLLAEVEDSQFAQTLLTAPEDTGLEVIYSSPNGI